MAQFGKALTMQRGLGLKSRAETMLVPRMAYARQEAPKLPPLVG